MKSLERWVVVLVILHTLIVGAFLLAAPAFAARFGGWGEASPLFFPTQAGIFHVVLGVAYFIEYFKYKGVTILVSAKAMAVLFLGTWTFLGAPWVVPFSALGDGLMGLAVFWIHFRMALTDGE